MRFVRQARIFCGPLDAAPVASVLLLLMIFMLLGSLLYTPGVMIHLPNLGNWPGTDNPTVVVAMDAADKAATLEKITRVYSVARLAGISDVLQAGEPTVFGRRP